jgi:hypothetical protein
MKLKTLAAAACLSLGVASAANALTLTLDDLGVGASPEVTITDAATPGLINFAGSAGGFDVVVSTGVGSPILGNAFEAEIDLSLITTGGTVGALQATLTDTGLSLTTNPTDLNATALSDLMFSSFDGAGVTIETFIRVGASTIFENLASLSGTSDSDLLDEITGTLGSGVLFDLRTVITVDHTSLSSSASASSNLTLSAVPLPAALPLLMASVAGIGFVGRRRKAA